ncbi:uncharacterized protein LOC144859695 [Branchiostoma floridae x Branchiostoma japonicum]
MAEWSQDLHVPGAVQHDTSPDKDQQAKGPNISHSHDSGCYTNSLDQPSPDDLGKTSKEETENGVGAELCVSGRGKEREGQVELAVSSGQDVASVQPTEDVASNPDPGKTTEAQDGDLAGETGIKKPLQESQPPLSCSGASLAVPDSDMTSLRGRRIALLSIFRSLEKTACQAIRDLDCQNTAEVNPAALHQISQARENLLLATTTAYTSDCPAKQTNQNPTEAHAHLPVSSSSQQNLVNEGYQDNTHVKIGQSQELKTGILTNITAKEDQPTCNSQEKRVQSEKPKNPVKNDPQEGKDKTGVLSNIKMKRRHSEELAKNVVLPPNNPVKEDSTDYKVKTGVPSTGNSLEKRGQPAAEKPKKPAVKETPLEGKDKTEIPSNNQAKMGQSEEQAKTIVLHPYYPIKEGSPDDRDKAGVPSTCSSLKKIWQPEKPKDQAAVKEDPSEAKDKTEVPSNTHAKTGQSESESKLLSKNPASVDSPDNKDRPGVPSTCSSLQKIRQPEKPKNPAAVKEDPPEGKDKTGGPSNTHVKIGQSEPKSKLLSKNPANEDSPDNKGKTGVSSTHRETEKLKSPVKEEPSKNKDKAGVSSNTQVKMGQTEEPAKKGIMSKNFHPVKDNGKDKTSVPSNSQEERSRAEYPLKKGTLSKKSVKDDKAVDLGQNDHCSLSREQLVQNEIIVEEEDEITTLKKVLSDFILPEEQEDATAEKGTPIKAEEDEVRGSQPVCSNSKKLETVVVNKRDEIEEENTSTSGKQGLIVQIRGDTSCHGAQEMPTSTEIPKKASLKTWMNRKLSFLIAVIVGLYSFLTSWSHKEKPPDANSFSKTDTSGITVEHDVQIHVYHMQSEDQDTPQDQNTPPDTDDHGDDQVDDHNTPEWLVLEDVDEDDDLYGGPTDEPSSTDSATVTAALCTEGPEGGQIAVDAGFGSHAVLPTDQLPATASGHCSQHLHRTPTQVVQDVLPATCALEAEIQHYRETERGISVTVLDFGGQVLGQTRIFAPTTVQEHLLEHVAALAFAACPMHGFTIRWPGGRTVPLGTLLDPHTAQNIILQMHHADEGDGTWQWRIVEICVGGRSAYTVEVNIHQQVSDGQAHSEQDWDRSTSESGSRGDGEEKVKDGDGKGSDMCTICLDADKVDLVVKTLCKHCFHQMCLRRWLDCDNRCPICRKSDPQKGAPKDADRGT